MVNACFATRRLITSSVTCQSGGTVKQFSTGMSPGHCLQIAVSLPRVPCTAYCITCGTSWRIRWIKTRTSISVCATRRPKPSRSQYRVNSIKGARRTLTLIRENQRSFRMGTVLRCSRLWINWKKLFGFPGEKKRPFAALTGRRSRTSTTFSRNQRGPAEACPLRSDRPYVRRRFLLATSEEH